MARIFTGDSSPSNQDGSGPVLVGDLWYDTRGAVLKMAVSLGPPLTWATTARRQPGWIDVRDYGAVGDGAANDTTAIQAAITAAGLRNAALGIPGATVYLPPGIYRLEGTGSELILVQQQVSIVGDGPVVSVLLARATVPATTDVLRLAPPLGANLSGTQLRNFGISSESPAAGRDGIVVDATVQGLSKVLYERLMVSVVSGRGFRLVNPTLNDGWYLATLRDCRFAGGIALQRAGDSILIDHCNCTGRGIGVEASFVSGASAAVLTRNNISSHGPALRITRGALVSITENTFETVSDGNYPAEPVVDLLGDPEMAFCPMVARNSINAAGVPGTDAIHLDYVLNGYIGPNVIAMQGAGRGIVTTPHTAKLTIDREAISWLGTGIPIADVSGRAMTYARANV